MSNFPARLRSLLAERGVKQWELADELYLSHSAVSDYARGKFEPSIATLCRMADIFGVSVDYLVGRTEVK